ncbi:MAG: 50S ribosomal protein L11 methyltransferase [Armatimonadetes bacterium]|nr:50S ribosomal protein L11 methyltransferase [Armatimonadota bacterium]
MQWRELTLRCPQPAAEAVAAILQDVAGGCASQDTPEGALLWAWLPEDGRLAGRLEELTGRLAALPEELLGGPPSVAERTVDDEDWAEAWKAYWHPTRVGRRLVIKPTWRDWPPADEPGLARPDDLIIELDPGMAFGTGAHATTVLCLEALGRVFTRSDGDPPPGPLPTGEGGNGYGNGCRVLDLGCGSGILSIAALKLGAGEALAIDADPLATQATAENCARNGVGDGCRVLLQDSLEGVAPGWDIIVANISLAIVTAVAPTAAELLTPGGLMICSGFYATRAEELAAALEVAGLRVESFHERESWGCMTARR